VTVIGIGRSSKRSGKSAGRKAFQDTLEIELTDTHAVGDGIAHGLRAQAPQAADDRGLVADCHHDMLADGFAGHASRHSRAHDRADRGAGNRNRANAELIQRFDDVDVRQAARAATAESNRNRWCRTARGVAGGRQRGFDLLCLLHRCPRFPQPYSG